MKKYLLIAVLSIFTFPLFGADELNLKEEFRYDQEQSLNEFVDAWIKGKESQRDLLKRFTTLVRTNNRYRQTLTSVDDTVVGKMIRAAANKNAETAVQKMNLAMMAYFKEKNMQIDTRSCFSSVAYEVKY